MGKTKILASSESATTLEITASRDVRAELARALITAGYDLLRMQQNERRLESIFMNLTRTGGPQ